jgi:hypothetical protein
MGKQDLSKPRPCEDLVVVNHNTVEKNVRKVLDVLDCRNRIWTKEEKANVSEALANLLVDEPVAIVENLSDIGKNAIREPIKRLYKNRKDDCESEEESEDDKPKPKPKPKPHDSEEEDECEDDKPKPKPEDKPKPKPEDKPKPDDKPSRK